MAISTAIAGPSLILGLPDVIWLMLVGIFFMGFFCAFLSSVPTTPEIIDAVGTEQKEKFR